MLVRTTGSIVLSGYFHLTLEGHSTPPTAFDAFERDMAIALQYLRGVGHVLTTRTYTNTWGYETFGTPPLGDLLFVHNATTYDWKITFSVKVWSLSGADCVLR